MNESYDVVVIGGGAAGLSGAAINMDLVAEDARHAVTRASMRMSA
jgi:succinate dehydrogenase/fumarate reductase flavoprotein subunit